MSLLMAWHRYLREHRQARDDLVWVLGLHWVSAQISHRVTIVFTLQRDTHVIFCVFVDATMDGSNTKLTGECRFVTMWTIWAAMYPDSKVHGAYMGPTWCRQDPGGPHVGPMNFAIWVVMLQLLYLNLVATVWLSADLSLETKYNFIFSRSIWWFAYWKFKPIKPNTPHIQNANT